MPHEIRIIRERKKDFLELLLLADEQENMIDLYLDRGELFALYDGGLKSVCVVTEETSDTCELKNLATLPAYQRQGYARALIRHISQYYRGHYRTMLVGTGETPAHSPFTNRADSSARTVYRIFSPTITTIRSSKRESRLRI